MPIKNTSTSKSDELAARPSCWAHHRLRLLIAVVPLFTAAWLSIHDESQSFIAARMLEVSEASTSLRQRIETDMQTYSADEIGWAIRDLPPEKAYQNVTDAFVRLFEKYAVNGSQHHDLTEMTDALGLDHVIHWKDFVFVLIPGLFTSWYPGYLSALQASLNDLELDARPAPINTDASVEENVAVITSFALNITRHTGQKLIFLTHSKGGVDAASAIARSPELADSVAAFVSMQTPYGGTPAINDLMHTVTQKAIAMSVLELLSIQPTAVQDLTYAARRADIARHPYPLHVPTICLATTDTRTTSSLKPAIDYIRLRYNELSDGCVAQKDAIIPGTRVVSLHDMNHFGPAYASFPGNPRYDPAAVSLLLAALAMDHDGVWVPPNPNVRSPAPLNTTRHGSNMAHKGVHATLSGRETSRTVSEAAAHHSDL